MSILPYEITLIATYMGIKERVIGFEGRRPWKPQEVERSFFQAETGGGITIMGRKTWETLLRQKGQGLHGRTNIVMTRGETIEGEGCIPAFSIEDVLVIINRCRNEARGVFVVGGEQIFRLFMPLASRLLISRIAHRKGKMPPGDTFFPAFDEKEFPIVPGTRRRESIKGGHIVFEERKRVSR